LLGISKSTVFAASGNTEPVGWCPWLSAAT
jgi:hypothetical protein